MGMLSLHQKDEINIKKFCILPQLSIAYVDAVAQEWEEITRHSEKDGGWIKRTVAMFRQLTDVLGHT